MTKHDISAEDILEMQRLRQDRLWLFRQIGEKYGITPYAARYYCLKDMGSPRFSVENELDVHIALGRTKRSLRLEEVAERAMVPVRTARMALDALQAEGTVVSRLARTRLSPKYRARYKLSPTARAAWDSEPEERDGAGSVHDVLEG